MKPAASNSVRLGTLFLPQLILGSEFCIGSERGIPALREWQSGHPGDSVAGTAEFSLDDAPQQLKPFDGLPI
jgi:hypothetical protein